MILKLIVAYDCKKGIGLKNNLPWKIKEDMKRFVELTKGKGNNGVIMGKNTYISIGKALRERVNYVLSSSLKDEDNKINILKEFKEIEKLDKNLDEIWVIGGSEIYNLFLEKEMVDELYITEIERDFKCDCFFPNIDLNKWKLIEMKENETIDGIKYKDKIYKRIEIKDQNKDCQ